MEKESTKLDGSKPTFISNLPCGEDLYVGKSQEKVAVNICKIIKYDNSCKIIGIDGGWGSGKSNIVRIVENFLSKEDFHFFIYDAWGHQEDLQRRSLLEELTEDLTKGILDSEKWKTNLKKILAKSKETEKKSIPSLSSGIVISGLAIIATPILKIISEEFSNLISMSFS